MSRQPFIAGNWKMYKTVSEAVKYVKEFRAIVKDVVDVELQDIAEDYPGRVAIRETHPDQGGGWNDPEAGTCPGQSGIAV